MHAAGGDVRPRFECMSPFLYPVDGHRALQPYRTVVRASSQFIDASLNRSYLGCSSLTRLADRLPAGLAHSLFVQAQCFSLLAAEGTPLALFQHATVSHSAAIQLPHKLFGSCFLYSCSHAAGCR
jgi:hypothetical protein